METIIASANMNMNVGDREGNWALIHTSFHFSTLASFLTLVEDETTVTPPLCTPEPLMDLFIHT